MEERTGKVWLIGAGPGDTGLFTLKGEAVLKRADVVIYDHLVGEGILDLIPKQSERIDAGKHAGNHSLTQDVINKLLLEKALEGKKVVRLKGGDPFLFGRGGEELELLWKNDIPFEIVPGVTSALAVPAYNGIPVTHREYTSSVHIITGHRKKGCEAKINYQALVNLGAVTLVFLMGVSRLPAICTGLIEAGKDKDTPAAILENGTTSRQRRIVATLSTLPEEAKRAEIKTPGIIIVGEVCRLAEKFHWAEDRPLGKNRVIVTRPKRKNSVLAERLRNLGAEVLEIPAVTTRTLPLSEEIRMMFDRLPEFRWLLFTSEAGVSGFFDLLLQAKKDVRFLSGLYIGVVGPATKAAVEQRGLLPDYMPGKAYGEELAAGVMGQTAPGDKILLVAPMRGPYDCEQAFRQSGAEVEVLPVYETKVKAQRTVTLSPGDIAAFASASAVEGLAAGTKGQDYGNITAVCIGTKTEKAAKKYGFHTIVSKEVSIDSMIDAIVETAQERRMLWNSSNVPEGLEETL